MKRVLLTIVAITISGAMASLGMERVLVPIAPRGELPGAEGSRWETSLTILNRAGVPVRIVPYDWNCQILCPPVSEHPDTPPGVTFSPALPVSTEVEGAFLFVDQAHAGNVAFQLRTRDLSRQALTHGTEIPVVREKEFLEGAASLLSVPVESRFRATLRVYDVDPSRRSSAILVRFYSQDPDRQLPFNNAPDTLLLERILAFTYAVNAGEVEFPGFIYFALSGVDELVGATLVRIDLVPLDPEARFWAFVSVTHNDTQHVKLITPQ